MGWPDMTSSPVTPELDRLIDARTSDALEGGGERRPPLRSLIVRAAAEFTVIVVGVLVALALDGWRQDREDRRQESQYLGAVVRELEAYIAAVQVSLSNNARAHDALEQSRAMWEQSLYIDNAGAFIGGLVVAVTHLTLPTTSTAIYEDIVNTGNTRLIQDEVLRYAILQTYSQISANLARLEQAESAIAPGLHALLARYLPPNLVSRGSEVFDVIVAQEPAAVAMLRTAAERLVSDAAFPGELNAEYRRLERARQQLSRHIEVTSADLARVQDLVRDR